MQVPVRTVITWAVALEALEFIADRNALLPYGPRFTDEDANRLLALHLAVKIGAQQPAQGPMLPWDDAAGAGLPTDGPSNSHTPPEDSTCKSP